jgi:hypothetical protein
MANAFTKVFGGVILRPIAGVVFESHPFPGLRLKGATHYMVYSPAVS